MKKLMLFAAAALMLFACSKDDNAPEKLQQGDVQKRVFYAVTEGTPIPGTKVYADDNLKLLWNEGDLVTVFDYINRNDQYYSDASDGANACAILLDEVGPTPSPQKDLEHIYAVYPYSSSNALNVDSDNGVTLAVTLPEQQNYKAKSFGVGANTMLAVADEVEGTSTFFAFKNVCGYLRFRFYGDNIKVKSIIFKGNNGEKIAGNAIVTPLTNAEEPLSVAMQSDATESITLNCSPAVQIGDKADNATDFIFVIPPTKFTEGFTVKVIDENGGYFEKEYNNPSKIVEIKRNKIDGMGAMKVTLSYNEYQLCKNNDWIDDGDYVLAYHNGNGGFNLFSFTKTMENAKTAANLVADVHGLEALLAKGSQIYATVLGNNYVTVAGEAGANSITVPEDIEADAMLSVTGGFESAQLTLSDGTYNLRLDKVITNIDESTHFATLAVQPNAADAIDIMYKLRGGRVVISFDEMIDFAVKEAKKEGITFEKEQVDRLKSGFEHVCRLAKEILANHNMNLMNIDLNTNVFDVIAQYYDNAAYYSYLTDPEKLLGFATPIGFYAGDNGFTANISLPQAGWFDRVQQSLQGNTTDFVNYWAALDVQYGSIGGFDHFFERLANRFVSEIDPSTFAMLKEIDFTAIGRVYGNYVTRFNDQLEPVYLYKKKVTE